MLDDRVLAAKAHIALLNKYPKADVTCEDGIVFVNISAPLIQEKMIDKQINGLLANVKGIKEIRTNIMPTNLSVT